MSPEFSRPQRVDGLAAGGLERRVEADAGECARLAARLDIPGIEALSCTWRLTAERRGRVLAEGHLTARLRRVCVVTLEEFPVGVDERFSVHFVPEGQEAADDDPESPDELPYEGGSVDLGEATAEQLALTLDPYPRKPGAVLPETGTAPEGPFAALRALKQ